MVNYGLRERALAPRSHRLPILLLVLLVVLTFTFVEVHGSAATDFLTMPALGRTDFTIGGLYNLATDTTIPYKLWDEAYIANYTFIERVNREQYKFATGDSYSAAWDLFDMYAELKMSFMCGLLSVKGSAALFKEKCSSYLTQRVSMLWQRESAWKSIRMEALFEHPERMYRKVLETGATHVIVKVEYGASYALSFEATASNEAEASEIAGNLNIVVRSIPGFAIEGKASLELSESQKQIANSLTVRSSGDIILPAPVTSYESAKQTCQNVGKYFKQTFGIGDDGMATGGGNPGNPLIVVMAPLKDFMDGARNLMYKISDDIVNEAVEVVERMDDILKRCNTKMEDMDKFLNGAFPRLTKEMQSFYNMINEFKQQTERSIQVLLPKIRSGFGQEILLSELVSQVNRRLDLVDPDRWLELKDQEAAQLRGLLEMLPRAVDHEGNSACELTRRAQDWVTATGFDDDQTIAIVLDFPLNQLLKPMRTVLFDPMANKTTMEEFRLLKFSPSASTITRFKQIRSFVERNNFEKQRLGQPMLRSVFIDRLSFPLVDVPPMSGSLKFHFYSGGAVLCPAFYAPAAPTLISVGLPAPNATTIILVWSSVPSCPRQTSFTIQITTNGFENKTVDVPVGITANLSKVNFTIDVADIAEQGMAYGFRVRSNSSAGFSDWSNQIVVVLQSTAVPIGCTAEWNSMFSNLTRAVAALVNEVAELRNQSNSLNARVRRYDDSVVLQKFMELVIFFVGSSQKTGAYRYSVFEFPNLVAWDMWATSTGFSTAPPTQGTPEWLMRPN